MRAHIAFPAAFFAALGLAAATAPPAHGETPIAIDGADEEQRKAILHLLPDRDPPQTLFDAERLGEEAAARASAWLRSEGYYAAQVTPQATDNPPAAHLIIAPGARFKFTAPDLTFDGETPGADAVAAAQAAIHHVAAGAP